MTILAMLNALICALIAARLIAFRRHGATFRPWASRLAYLLIVITASVPLRALFGTYRYADFSEVSINAILCISVFAVRGNIMELFRAGWADNAIGRLLKGNHGHPSQR